MMAPNGTRFGSWTLDTANNQFGPAGDYDGDGHAEILVTSPSGIAILKLSGGTMTTALMAANNGTRFGGWLLNTADNRSVRRPTFDGDRHDELFVASPWGIGILKLTGAVLNAPMMQPNGTRFGGWLLNTADNNFGEAGDYDGDGHAEILVNSPWGLGILKMAGATHDRADDAAERHAFRRLAAQHCGQPVWPSRGLRWRWPCRVTDH